MRSSQESQAEKMMKIGFSAAAPPAAAPGGESWVLNEGKKIDSVSKMGQNKIRNPAPH